MILAANDLPSINDVTYPELIEIIAKVTARFPIDFSVSIFASISDFEVSGAYYQLKDENGQLAGVDASGLLVANSGNDLPVRKKK